MSPVDNQVFQRLFKESGDIQIKLKLKRPLSVENLMVCAAYGSDGWHVIRGKLSNGGVFSGVLQGQPVGRDVLRIKIGKSLRVIWGVAIGDVFVPIGQSNEVGALLAPNKLKGGTRFTPMAFVNGRWVPCEDPINPYLILQTTKELLGSVWPLVAQRLSEENPDVPIGIVDVGRGGTSLVNRWPDDHIFGGLSWKDEDPYFSSATNIIKSATSDSCRFRSFLWLQGESDVLFELYFTSDKVNHEDKYRLLKDRYKSDLKDLVSRIRRDLGNDCQPIFVIGQIGRILPKKGDRATKAIEAIRSAQREIVDQSTFFSGPDGALVPVGEDGLHFQTKEAAELLSSMWVESIRSLPPLMDH